MAQQNIINFLDEKKKRDIEDVEDYYDLNKKHDIELSLLDSFFIEMIILEGLNNLVEQFKNGTIPLNEVKRHIDSISSQHYSVYYGFYNSYAKRKSSIVATNQIDLLSIINLESENPNYIDAISKSCCAAFNNYEFEFCDELLNVSLYMSYHLLYITALLSESYFFINDINLKSRLNEFNKDDILSITQNYNENLKRLITIRKSTSTYKNKIKTLNIWRNIDCPQKFKVSLRDNILKRYNELIISISQNKELMDYLYTLANPIAIEKEYNSNELNKRTSTKF